MKKWPVIRQIRNFRLLRKQPKTRQLAWPYLKSYAAYVVVTIIFLPVIFPLYCVGTGMRSAGEWVLARFYIPFGSKLRENYERRKREAYKAYAPFRKLTHKRSKLERSADADKG